VKDTTAVVSVIIPVYNTEKYLADCVDSVLRQTNADFEVILVDDGSTDTSGQQCDEYATREERVSAIHQENRGPSAARNAAMAVAVGTFFAFVDSDDWISPDYLETLLALVRDASADMAMCATVVEDGERQPPPSFVAGTQCLSGWEVLEQAEALYPIDTVSQCGKLMRRELWSGLEFPEGRLHEDTFVMPHVIHRASRVACTKQGLYHYRQRPGSTTWGDWSLPSRLDKARGLAERARFLRSIGVGDRATKDFARAFAMHLDAVADARRVGPGRGGSHVQEISEQRKVLIGLSRSLPLSRKFRVAAWSYRLLPNATTAAYRALRSHGRRAPFGAG